MVAVPGEKPSETGCPVSAGERWSGETCRREQGGWPRWSWQQPVSALPRGVGGPGRPGGGQD